ncbi:alternate-type signal peptide domain-containing protein [Leucobacter luti]|uniref:Alternate signal-mediated exported protein n=1 Tax=Leucobacter luti TaxID=340320 RepID=A0A4Q7U089_9MICO|nr:alternate-type signal peptide domain-containing protein [Leucobacter luti]MBL3699142.1 alternate-type signal peptide domain-containing protein [Leucobacter luti]RZT66643.1 alternate signal-mediated exported protein [Leucobacter luti]
MSEMNNDQIIVVSEPKKRRRGLLWVAAGAAALLAGGSTFALWAANDTFSGGTITAGDLNLVQLEDTSFWDVSNDRVDATETVGASDGSQPGHKITDVNTWRIAPGDKLAASFEATATLDGDNLVARVGIDGLDQLANTITGMNYSYEVYYGDALLVSETVLPTTADAPLLYLSAPAAGQDEGAEDATNGILGSTATTVTGVAAQSAVFGMPATTVDLNVVIYASFYEDQDGDFRYQDTDVTVEDRTDVQLADTLGDLTVSLSQVRDTGAQFS